MFISRIWIEEALKKLESVHPFYGITFLVCKFDNLPVGNAIEYSISTNEKLFLEKYYKPNTNTAWYYRVFRVSNKSQDWLRTDYPSSGSQRTRTSTFKDAFIHPKRTKLWGWSNSYIKTLNSNLYLKQPIQAFHLAVWLYRDHKWPADTTSDDIINTFFNEFKITEEEKNNLFDPSPPAHLDSTPLFQNKPVSWIKLEASLGILPPPDALPDRGGTLSLLELSDVGPAKKLQIEFAKRINLITGDNGLGKTFILECAWWALSGSWSSSPAYPRSDATKNSPQITFEVEASISARTDTASSRYDWKRQEWPSSEERLTIPGLLIYARVDGAFAVWDPARNNSSLSETDESGALFFTREDIWHGLPNTLGGKTRYLSNGLINDWVNWQNSPHISPFETLKRVLRRLSPPELARGDLGPLEPGKPTRIPGDSRLIPTIKHPYGDVPLVYASAAVRRIVALAYLIVWTWEEHKTQSELIRETPQKRMVILIDEIEAHLHPQWQRKILPALLDVQEELEADIQVQFLIATHSSLVLASLEPRFDVARDKIFHLNLLQHADGTGEVVLEEPEFTRYGTIDAWLTSEIFELQHARSLEAEQAIESAKEIQIKDHVTSEEVREISERLVQYLAAHDKFWPRWTFFAEQHGVEL